MAGATGGSFTVSISASFVSTSAKQRRRRAGLAQARARARTMRHERPHRRGRRPRRSSSSAVALGQRRKDGPNGVEQRVRPSRPAPLRARCGRRRRDGGLMRRPARWCRRTGPSSAASVAAAAGSGGRHPVGVVHPQHRVAAFLAEPGQAQQRCLDRRAQLFRRHVGVEGRTRAGVRRLVGRLRVGAAAATCSRRDGLARDLAALVLQHDTACRPASPAPVRIRSACRRNRPSPQERRRDRARCAASASADQRAELEAVAQAAPRHTGG